MPERGVTADHATINRWVIKYRPQKAMRRHGVPETITIDGSEANAAQERRAPRVCAGIRAEGYA
jgi:transposase-like protein